MTVPLWAFVCVTWGAVADGVSVGSTHQREGRASQPFLIGGCQGQTGKEANVYEGRGRDPTTPEWLEPSRLVTRGTLSGQRAVPGTGVRDCDALVISRAVC